MTENYADQVLDLYSDLLTAWNRGSAEDFAEAFGASGSSIGFDGSMMNGRAEILPSLRAIFAHHSTAAYVARVREIRPLADGVTLVRAVAGMIPPGGSEVDTSKNAIQSLVVVDMDGRPQIALFHNTPAAFHGRPELTESMTEELSEVARAGLVLARH